MSEFFNPLRFQPVDGNGDVLVGARLYFYDEGTTNQRTVYTTAAKTTAHTQPVVALADGRFPAIYLPDGNYKFVLKEDGDPSGTDGTTIYTEDNVPGPVATSTVTSAAPNTPVTTLTSETTLTATDFGKKFNVDSTGGDFSVFLPTSIDNDGGKIEFQHTGTSGTVTIDGHESQTVNGAGSIVLTSFNDFAVATADGANFSALVNDVGEDSIKLTDLDDSITGRLFQVGMEIEWPFPTSIDPPAGWLDVKGQSLLKTDYPELYALMGDYYGTADSLHFNMPNRGGMFKRGINDGRSDSFADPDAATRLVTTTAGATMVAGADVGTEQVEDVGPHTHGGRFSSITGGGGGGQAAGATAGVSSNTLQSETNAGTQTCPNNVSTRWIMFVSPSLAAGASVPAVNQLLNGSGTPGSGTGVDGDFYLDTSATPFTLYGPKVSGAWPTGYVLGSIQHVGNWGILTSYLVNYIVNHNGSSYAAIINHTSGIASEPGVGINSASHWRLIGAKGDDGFAGPTLGLSWVFSQNTSPNNIAGGQVRFNNADLSLATELYLSDADRNGETVSPVVDTWRNSNSNYKSELHLIDPANSDANYAVFRVSSGTPITGGRQLTVEHLMTAGTFSNGGELVVTAYVVGDAGTGAVTAFNGRSGNVLPAANDYGTDEITNDSALIGSTLTEALDTLEPRENFVINGDFFVNQDDFGGGAVAAANWCYDNWYAGASGANINVSGENVTFNSGTIKQVIESPKLNGKTVVFSVGSLASGNLNVTVDGVAKVLTPVGGGRVGVSFDIDSGSTGDIQIEFGPSSGAVTFKQVKLEIGTVPTVWRYESRETRVHACQRYYVRVSGVNPDYLLLRGYGGTGVQYKTERLPVKMRSSPTMTLLNVTQSNASSASTANAKPLMFEFFHTLAAASGFTFYGYTADARIVPT